MAILVITRKVDGDDSRVGFFNDWLNELAERIDNIYVLSWQSGSAAGLRKNVNCTFLQGGILNKIINFERELISLLPKVRSVFCHMNPEYAILAAFFTKLWRRRLVVWYTHKAITWRRRLMEIAADIIVTASDESFRQPWFRDKLVVAGHGINLDRFIFSLHKYDDKILKLLTVGRITPTKDIESIIRALSFLDKSCQFNLKIVGETALPIDVDYLSSLETMVKSAGLTDRVEFVGGKKYDLLPLYYTTADIFINFSNTGSLDKAVLEAMASGCLVVTSNEAFKRIIPAACLVSANRPEELAKVIIQLESAGEAFKLNLAGQLRREVENHHNLRDLISRLVNLLAH